LENRFRAEITDMNENGAGIAKHDGCIVFVNGAVTGDICEIDVTEQKKNYALGEIVTLEKPSPLRCDSGCDVYARCGGCSLRHITFEEENRIKRQMVANAFRRAGLRDIPVRETLFSEPEGYRNKAVFHFADGKFGYYSEKTNEPVAVLPCPLLPDSINSAAGFINGLVSARENRLSGIGFRYLYLRTTADGDLSVVFGVGSRKDIDLLLESGMIPALAGAFPAITGILSAVGDMGSPETRYSVLFGERELQDTLCSLRFIVSPEGFWQVNNAAACMLGQKVLEYASAVDFDTCIDLYCGSGTFGLILAAAHREKHTEYYGVELNPRSIADAKRNAALNGLDNITFFCGDAADFRKNIPAEARKNSLVIIDPPRAGCSPKMLSSLTALSPDAVIYISCSPNTLGRDCARLVSEGYRIAEVTPVNLFPRTKHCESVVLLRRDS